MTESGNERWLGREGLAWSILLVAALEEPPPTPVLQQRLAQLLRREGMPSPTDGALVAGELGRVLATLSELRDPDLPVSLGRTASAVVVRGHHAHVDGLGLLAVLRDVAAEDLVSRASGVGDRGQRSTLATVAGRLVEAVARPPAGVSGLAASAEAGAADDFATVGLPHHVTTAEVAHAAAQAITARNRAAGTRGERVAVAVGVSTVGGRDLRVAENSGFLRLTNAERLDPQAMARALGEAPLQVGGTARSTSARRAGRLIRWGSGALSSRLGSTVLVSHLGRVEAKGLTGLAFYPLAGNGSGLSVGAATVRDKTTITLRARGARHGATELEHLLDAIATRLT